MQQQAVPKCLAITESSQSTGQLRGRRRGRPKGSLNKSTLAKREQRASQEGITQTNSQSGTSTRQHAGRLSKVLRSGKTTGVRCSGLRTQPSIRRSRSQWELAKGDGEDAGCVVVRQQN